MVVTRSRSTKIPRQEEQEEKDEDEEEERDLFRNQPSKKTEERDRSRNERSISTDTSLEVVAVTNPATPGEVYIKTPVQDPCDHPRTSSLVVHFFIEL